jgi:hypothetical protein
LKRTLRLSLLILGLIAILSAQTWFSFGLTTGGNLEVAGFEAYPFLSGALLSDFLAVALVLYLRKRWGAVFLAAAIVGLSLTLIATLPGAFGIDLGVAAPVIEKATGVASWLSQLESIVVSKSASALGGLSWVLIAVLVLVHVLAFVQVLRNHKERVSKSVKDFGADRSGDTSPDLWSETSELRGSDKLDSRRDK